jgi:hypothetical protein
MPNSILIDHIHRPHLGQKYGDGDGDIDGRLQHLGVSQILSGQKVSIILDRYSSPD